MIPIRGAPPAWAWFPRQPSPRAHRLDAALSARAAALWTQYFVYPTIAGAPGRPVPAGRMDAPPVYWSSRLGVRAPVHARTYSWGIVLSRRAVGRVRRAHRPLWLRQLLLHELLHWAGYAHDAAFRAAARRLGTW